MSIFADETQAMRALQAGDDRGLDTLMALWKDRLTNYLYRLLGRYQDAVEVAQEVFVKVYFDCHKFNLERPFGPWAYTIASNLAKNRFRWRSRHPASQLEEAATQAGEAGSSEGLMMECLATLPTELREVIVLFDLEEKSHEEIAVIIGKGRKTVEARLYKARAALKKAYEAAQGRESVGV